MSKNHFTFLFGINPVREKLASSPRDVLEIIVTEGGLGIAASLVEREARRLGLPVRAAPSRALDRLARGEKHQGVLAKVLGYAYADFSAFLRDLSVAPGPKWILVLDCVTDPRNFGALLRTAEGAGIGHVVISKDHSVGVTPVVFKASAGAASHLRIYRVPNLRRAIASFKRHGYWAVGLSARGSESLYARTYPDKLAVVLGAEGEGIRPLIERECDFVVSIPMRGKIDSLNVAVAGGVFFYEILRQREEHLKKSTGGA